MADKVKLNMRELNKLMRSPKVQSEVNARAARISAAAGPKYRIVPSPHRYTARTFVEPVPDTRISDADQSTLLRAFDSGRA